MVQIKTPEFPESVYEASVGAWFKSVGDELKAGEAIVELHTDKAVQEINAIEDGVLTAILKQVDDVVMHGDALCEVDPVGSVVGEAPAMDDESVAMAAEPDIQPVAAADAVQGSAADAPEAESAPTDSDVIRIEVAQPIPMGSVSTTVSEPLAVAVANVVELDDVPAPEPAVETAAGGQDGEGPQDLAASGESVGPLAVDVSADATEIAPAVVEVIADAAPVREPEDAGESMGESAEALADDVPTGASEPAPVIVEVVADVADVQEPEDAGVSEAANVEAPAEDEPTDTPEPAPNTESADSQQLAEARESVSDRPVERVRLTRRQLTAARRMVQVKQQTVMTTTFNEVDMQQIIGMRARHGARFLEEHGVKLGFMAFFIKATCAALKAYPVLNAEIADDELVLKQYYDIGIAVASDRGLVVPVIRDADSMSFSELEVAIRGFATKASSGSWRLSDLAGGTFTITNGGVFGSMLSTPILNPPQVGILGMHNIVERPIAVDGKVEVRPMMYLALTYDHRIVEGAQAVQFLRHIKSGLESADVLLLST